MLSLYEGGPSQRITCDRWTQEGKKHKKVENECNVGWRDKIGKKLSLFPKYLLLAEEGVTIMKNAVITIVFIKEPCWSYHWMTTSLHVLINNWLGFSFLPLSFSYLKLFPYPSPSHSPGRQRQQRECKRRRVKCKGASQVILFRASDRVTFCALSSSLRFHAMRSAEKLRLSASYIILWVCSPLW